MNEICDDVCFYQTRLDCTKAREYKYKKNLCLRTHIAPHSRSQRRTQRNGACVCKTPPRRVSIMATTAISHASRSCLEFHRLTASDLDVDVKHLTTFLAGKTMSCRFHKARGCVTNANSTLNSFTEHTPARTRAVKPITRVTVSR